LSGHITPSLDEMVHVAKEMKRQGFDTPLLIGGATTSRQHTAVKIAPEYANSTVHVLDASRAVGTVSALLDPKGKAALDRDNRAEQEKLRQLYARKAKKPMVSFETAVRERPKVTFRKEDLAKPEFIGRRVLEGVSLGDIASYIDWTFFFTAWDLPGKYPDILQHPQYGQAARDLFDNGKKLLRRIVDERLLAARAVYGFWPANADGEDVVLYADEARSREIARFPMLRQQQAKTDGEGYRSLADFVAPRDSKLPDYVGAFAVTAGIGADALAKTYQEKLDDFSAICVKALADRLAEAFAELLHQRARREWGYGKSETLTVDDLIAERYRGIRPAFGYPACPDHSEKGRLFDLLDAKEVGITLTESFAMMPPASVSGLYFAHPESRYFSVGRIDRDQVADYARRKGTSVSDVERWLAPSLGYEPSDSN
jgi:5-methyltetrahydrofolate--homocysteine methyltransferase